MTKAFALQGDSIHIAGPGYEESSGAVFSRSLLDPINTNFDITINHLNDGARRNERHASYHGICLLLHTCITHYVLKNLYVCL